jgi:probable HAF family extracellular repeat protein
MPLKTFTMGRLMRSVHAVSLLSALAVPGLLMLGAGSAGATLSRRAMPRYVAIDLGTLGGPNTFPNTPGRTVSENGIFVGTSETPDIYPFTQWCGDGCHVSHAFEWRNGTMTDLGTTGGYGAGLFELNGAGVGVGYSETGALDPLTDAPVTHAAISTHGHLVDLGTLGGTQSWAVGINGRGEVSGFATNTTRDPYALNLAPLPSTTQWRATLWHKRHIQDLGTLGGPDSEGGLLNEQGQAAGWSMTNSTPNDATGLPTIDPFLWHKGRMRDLGNLGGVQAFPSWLNSRGEVVGLSDLAGDQTSHPFLWNGRRLRDLGTLGGDNGEATWINNPGSVVGRADLPGSEAHHAFLWKNGAMRDLAPTGEAPCSNAFGINGREQVVGNATDCQGNSLGAVMWDHGAAYDLNRFAPPTVFLSEGYYINDRGEIACFGFLPNGDAHQVLLVPADVAAREGLSPASDRTHPAPAAVRRSAPDPRDVMRPVRQRLAPRSGPRFR